MSKQGWQCMVASGCVCAVRCACLPACMWQVRGVRHQPAGGAHGHRLFSYEMVEALGLAVGALMQRGKALL